MKRLTLSVALLFAFFVAAPCFGQQETVPELKAQIADLQQENAKLQQQITELQIRVALAEKAALGQGVDQARQQAQQRVEATTQAAQKAHTDANAAKAGK